jgi:hypothetical protein
MVQPITDEADRLWQRYDADRTNTDARDHLVTHYFDSTWKIILKQARYSALRDPENACADFLWGPWVNHVIPRFDPKRCESFERWSVACWRRYLIDCHRRLRRQSKVVIGLPGEDSDGESAAIPPAPDNRPSEVGLGEFLRTLPPWDAAVMWLRHGRGETIHAIATALDTHPSKIKHTVAKHNRALRLLLSTLDI